MARLSLRHGLLAAVLIGASAWTSSAMGHHSFAAVFTLQKPITMSGTITEVEWANPHCHAQVLVTSADGKQTPWTFEFGAPMALHKAGMTRSMLPAGQKVTITGYAAKDNTNLGWVSKFEFPDGRVIRITPDTVDAPPAS